MSSTRMYIPERFTREISLHITKNTFASDLARIPLILGIHGPPGYGKTFQCEQVIDEMGVTAFLISGGQLESGTAGEPAKLVRETYIKASQSIRKGESRAAVILINDFDTALGNWGKEVQTTINTQTVYGELMHLTDYPNSVAGVSTHRIPLILTGNDFTKLYEPLVRAGRMNCFEWHPLPQEKAEMVSSIFPELEEDSCERLVHEFSSQSIAFYSHLRSALIDDILWEEIQKAGVSKIVEYITSDYYKPELYALITYESLLESGNRVLSQSQLTNHLRN